MRILSNVQPVGGGSTQPTPQTRTHLAETVGSKLSVNRDVFGPYEGLGFGVSLPVEFIGITYVGLFGSKR